MNIHDAYKQEQHKEILRSYQHLVGKYVFCRANEENTTRLFVDNMNDIVNALTKDGHWDVFTITDKEHAVNPGLYICRIESYRLDKNNYLVQTVTPIVEITKEDEESGEAYLWLIYITDMFADFYNFHTVDTSRFNIEHLYSMYEEEFREWAKENYKGVPGETAAVDRFYFCQMIFEWILAKKITITKVNEALLTKYPIEILAEDIRSRLESFYKEAYPVFYSEIKRKRISTYSQDAIIHLLQDASFNYERMVEDGRLENTTNDLVRRVEIIREYYVKLHEDQKANKAAERKARKKKKDSPV